MGSLDSECLLEEEASKACQEYSEKLDQLNAFVKAQGPFVEQLKEMASDLQQVKLTAAKVTPAKDSPELRAALEAAKKAGEEFGNTSPEAALAWETVEEIAAASNAPALGGKLTDECLVEAIEACEALDELNKALNLD